MKKLVLFAAAAVAVISCAKQMNDLVHEEVVAEITAFKAEGELSSAISKASKTVEVKFAEGTDLSKVTVSTFTVTEGATCTPDIKAGDIINLSEPVTVTLTTYDPYVWTVKATAEKTEPDPTQDPDPENPDPQTDPDPQPKEGPQLYNMGFDHWMQYEDKKFGGAKVDVLYDEDATEEEKTVWGSAAASTKMLGYDSVLKETEFLAVTGEGKKALKLQTCGISAMFGLVKKLAAGSVFNGYTGDIDIAKMSAHIFWGIPFTEKPKTLEGYACYKPAKIDWTQDPYKSMEGQLDKGHVIVILSDWTTPFDVCPPSSLLDFDNDPGIIGYGKVVFDKEMTAYEKFTVNIEYRNERTPKLITIVCSSSALGDYFTGGAGSTLYLDEFKLTY
ncbi:MAG: PCMD domain-containing protein [Bacteroidales bacterium]|nr:PCMD domain-containing protein [Bacteroidales bacterium]